MNLFGPVAVLSLVCWTALGMATPAKAQWTTDGSMIEITTDDSSGPYGAASGFANPDSMDVDSYSTAVEPPKTHSSFSDNVYYTQTFVWDGDDDPDMSFAVSGNGNLTGDATAPPPPDGSGDSVAPDGGCSASSQIGQSQPEGVSGPSANRQATADNDFMYDVNVPVSETLHPNGATTFSVVIHLIASTTAAYNSLHATDSWTGNAESTCTFSVAD